MKTIALNKLENGSEFVLSQETKNQLFGNGSYKASKVLGRMTVGTYDSKTKSYYCAFVGKEGGELLKGKTLVVLVKTPVPNN